MSDRPNPLKDQMELLKFLREEAAANRVALQEEAAANRKLLTDTFKILSPIIIAVIAFAGFWGFHDLNAVKQTVRDAAQAEARTEMNRMDRDVQDTVAAKFKPENIQQTIRNAAQAAAREEAKPLIQAGVNSEVRVAVAAQSEMIRRISREAVNDKVQEVVSPLAKGLNESVTSLHIQGLVAGANLDDAKAFDELLALSKKGGTYQRELISGSIADRYRHLGDIAPFNGNGAKCLVPNSNSVRADFSSSDLAIRKQMLYNCEFWMAPGGERAAGQDLSLIEIQCELVPLLIKVALEDSSLFMRTETIGVLNEIFRSAPGFPSAGLDRLNLSDLRAWQSKSEPNLRYLILLADAGDVSHYGFDSVEIYDEIAKEQVRSPTSLGELMKVKRLEMVKYAEEPSDDSTSRGLKVRGLNSCPSVEDDLLRRRPRVFHDHRFGLADRDAHAELEYLKLCPANPKILSELSEIAIGSDSLSGRYAAITVINQWEKTAIDPFDTSAIRGWWSKHKVGYPD